MHAKFVHSSFSRSRGMVGAHQNLNGSRDLTMPLSGIVCRPWASTINQYAKFEASIIPTTKIRKAIQNSENEVVWVVTGHSTSLEIAPFDRAHTSTY